MLRALALAALLAATAAARADVAVPELKAHVTDLTGTLTAAQRETLEQRLAAFEQRKGSQVAVLIVPTTQPEAIEQYSMRVVEAWKLGRKDVDDGVLLLVARDDRELRIEVGYGLEGALPDAIAKRIIAETIVPHFREDDYYGGISAGVDQVLRVVDGEKLPERRLVSPEEGLGAPLQVLLAIGIFLLGLVRPIGKAIGEFPVTVVSGGIFGVICWVLAGALVGMFGGLLFMVVALFVLMSRGAHYTGIGSIDWGSSRGGSRSGGGGSRGGGFSGGGGGFGGGGASGKW